MSENTMPESFTPDVWRERLSARGHRVLAGDGLAIWSDPNTIITVALEPDPTLLPEFRGRYFLCDPEPEHVLRVTGCPELQRDRWLSLVSRQPPSRFRDFLAGPGSWLLSRLARFKGVVIWIAKVGRPQGQRSLWSYPGKYLQQELVAPAARSPLHCDAVLAGVLLEQR